MTHWPVIGCNCTSIADAEWLYCADLACLADKIWQYKHTMCWRNGGFDFTHYLVSDNTKQTWPKSMELRLFLWLAQIALKGKRSLIGYSISNLYTPPPCRRVWKSVPQGSVDFQINLPYVWLLD